MHLRVDESTAFIHAQVLIKNGEGEVDSQQFGNLLEQIQSLVDRVSGDGADDIFDILGLLILKGIQRHIPPKENAVYQLNGWGNPIDHPHNNVLDQMAKEGINQWKKMVDIIGEADQKQPGLGLGLFMGRNCIPESWTVKKSKQPSILEV